MGACALKNSPGAHVSNPTYMLKSIKKVSILGLILIMLEKSVGR
jgi:hypothetical protein